MDQTMFCFQCEQTAQCQGCTGAAGVCGKSAGNAKLQDQLTGALIGLARAAQGKEGLLTRETDRVMLEGLFATVTNVSFDDEAIEDLIDRVHEEAGFLYPSCMACPACVAEDYDMEELWQADEDIRSLKSLLLFGVRGMAAYAYHAWVLGYEDKTVNRFFYKALAAVGTDHYGMKELLPLVMEVGEVNLTCMALLDRANTETYGTPQPTEVTMTVEKGPFIVVTGHDLYDQ